MNRLEAMHLFVRVAEAGSFSAVADQLNIARSVVTRQIAALESHLGTKLMVRNTRSLTLTTAGSVYLEKCKVILEMIDEAEAGVIEERETPRGPIRIGLPLSFGLKKLTPLLLDFCQQHPDITCEFDFSDGPSNLIEEGMDLSIRVASQLEPRDIVRKLGECRLHIVASPEYLKNQGIPQHPSELTHHQCLGYTFTANGMSWSFMKDGKKESYYIQSRIKANNGTALMDAAAHGLGITRQPYFIADEYLRSGQVVEILEGFDMTPLGIYAILPSNRYVPHRVRVLLEFLAENLNKKNAE